MGAFCCLRKGDKTERFKKRFYDSHPRLPLDPDSDELLGAKPIHTDWAFVLGGVSGILLNHETFTAVRTIIGTGFCGGYTTFSTASFETVRLFERREYGRALGNMVGGTVATLLAIIGILVGCAF